MAITAISTDWGVDPRVIRMTTTDDFTAITTVGYWTAQQPNIQALNNGQFTIYDGELVAVIYAGGEGFVSYNAENKTFQALPNSGNVSSSLPAGQILVGNASNVATAVAMSGAIAINDAGVTSINSGAISAADIAANAIGSSQLALDIMQLVSVDLTALQFKDMYGAPFEIIPAPGAGNLIVIDQMNLLMVYGTTPYAAGGPVLLQYGSSVHGAGQAASATIAAANLQGSASDAELVAGVLSNAAFSSCVDMPVYLSNQTAAFATGDSTFICNVWYRVVSV